MINKEVMDILSRYGTNGENYAQIVEDLNNKLSIEEFIVPVLGIQGKGKSTIINALLGEDALPSEADETTCVPVEVRYSDTAKTVVHFYGSKPSVTIEGGKSSLAEFVDNNYNPANEKKVERIALYGKYDILKNGMVIVDLPGVGSLTTENEETTMKYIKNCAAAMLVISDAPPITNQESAFIRILWKTINTLFVIQNSDHSSSAKDIADSLAWNKKVLEKIAKEENVTGVGEVIHVDGWLAAKGAFTKNSEEVEKSNLNAFIDMLKSFEVNYKQNLNKVFEERVDGICEGIARIIEDRIKQSEMDEEELVKLLTERSEEFTRASDDIDERVRLIRRTLADGETIVGERAAEIAEKHANLLRANVFGKVDSGITDGKHLTEVFSDEQAVSGAAAIADAKEIFEDINYRLAEQLEELEDIIKDSAVKNPDAEMFTKDSKLKWEKGADLAIKIGGVIGGALFFGWIGCIAVGIISSLLGGGLKKNVRAQRANETKRELEPYINKFRKNLERSIVDAYRNMQSSVLAALNAYREEREGQLSVMKEKIEEVKAMGNVHKAEADKLRHDLEVIKARG